jgi:hypothetical protein
MATSTAEDRAAEDLPSGVETKDDGSGTAFEEGAREELLVVEHARFGR